MPQQQQQQPQQQQVQQRKEDAQHVVNIPVNREPCTFEQHRRNMLNELEQSSGGQVGESLRGGNTLIPCRDDWNNKIDNWINSSWKRWDDEMQRIRSGMFALLPLEHFGVNQWCEPLLQNPYSLMNQMEEHIQELRDRMGMDHAPVTGTLTDFLKDAYELGDDGKVHFKVRFDAKGFAPEDINVSTTANRLTVHAKKVTDDGSSKRSREFCRMIDLPQSINHEQLKCNLTNDGVLMLDAPVKSPDYKSITFNDNNQMGIQPKSGGQIQASSAGNALVVKGISGPTVLDDGPNGKRLHVEVAVDPIFKPEDVCVNVDANSVTVSGSHHREHGGCFGNSSSVARFSHTYNIPETVDPLTVSAQLLGGTLVLEAPLMKQHAVKQQKDN